MDYQIIGGLDADYLEKLQRFFWEKVHREPDGCWTWTAALSKCGYGLICVHRKTNRAHRLSYELYVGPIPPGMHVAHRCDNPPCIRPDHLFVASNQKNIDDMKAKRRHKFGINHHAAVLTPEQVIEIRNRYVPGEITQKQLANEYGVSHGAVHLIVTGQRWTHI